MPSIKCWALPTPPLAMTGMETLSDMVLVRSKSFRSGLNYTYNFLKLNDIPNQRKLVEEKFPYYINQWINYAKSKNII